MKQADFLIQTTTSIDITNKSTDKRSTSILSILPAINITNEVSPHHSCTSILKVLDTCNLDLSLDILPSSR